MSEDPHQLNILRSSTSTLPHNENDYVHLSSVPAGWRREDPGVLLGFVQPAGLKPDDGFLKFAPLDDDECGFPGLEGDVFAATILYLANPINSALMRDLPKGSLTMSCEHGTGTSRTNICWTLRTRDGQTRVIAVLELKAKGVLRFEDFQKAMATDDMAERRKLRDAYSNWAPNKGTFFEKNAFWLVKQATKFAGYLNVHDVAIFDWNSMFILDYSKWEESYREKSSRDLKLPRGIWMDENPQNNLQRQSLDNFRAALYGFLRRALDRYKQLDED